MSDLPGQSGPALPAQLGQGCADFVAKVVFHRSSKFF
jgi:hypothetical protein